MTQLQNPAQCGVRCDLCGNQKFTLQHQWEVGNYWNPATIPLATWVCDSCELIILHPVPKGAQLPDAGEWWSNKRKQYPRHPWLKQKWKSIRFAIFGDQRTRLLAGTRKAKPSGRLLDIGCGYGDFLSLCAPYYRCVGLEPSPIATAEARQRGFDVIQSTFEDAQIAPQSFDVVVLDSVIEHVDGPTETLAKINYILKPDGVVVLKTPKFGGPAYKTHRAGWRGYRHGYHTFLYTGNTLGKYLEKTGFEVLEKPKRDRMLDDVLILWGRKTCEVSEVLKTKAAA